MNTKIIKYVNDLFKNSPQTKKTNDIKEELISNLNEKYNDLINLGQTEKEAYTNTINSIGDVNELLSSLKDNIVYDIRMEKVRKRRALAISISVILYILSMVPIIIIECLGLNEELALIPFIIIIAFATGILIYNSIANPKFSDKEIISDFKNEYVNTIVKKTNKKKRKNTFLILVRIVTIILVLAIYVLLSFILKIELSGISGLLLLLSLIVVDQLILTINKLVLLDGGKRNEK